MNVLLCLLASSLDMQKEDEKRVCLSEKLLVTISWSIQRCFPQCDARLSVHIQNSIFM
jgi:hypothetical protein